MLLSRAAAAVRAALGMARSRELDAVRILLEAGALRAQHDAVAVVRADGELLLANPPGRRIAAAAVANAELARAASEAIAHGALQRAEIAIPTEHGADTFEGTVSPFADRSAALFWLRDVTRDRRVHQALVESRQRYKDLVEISSDLCWETDAAGRFAFVSPQGALGYSAAELLALDPNDLFVDAASDHDASPFATRERVVDAELWLRRADGANALVRVASVPVLDPGGAWVGARGVCRDITRERERDTSLARAQMRERLIAYVVRTIHDEPDPANVLAAAAAAAGRGFGAESCRIYVLDDDGSLVSAASFGAPDAAAGETAAAAGEAAIVADTTRHGQRKLATIGGRSVACIATRSGKSINGAFVLARESSSAWPADDIDLAEEVALQLATAIDQYRGHVRLEALSRTDELTKLLNRRAFFAELATRLARNAAGQASAALFFVDLDNFKRVNDVHGHQRGDEALKAVAELLRVNSRPGDLVSRLGGDEFALWLDRTDAAAAAGRAEQLLAAAQSLRRFSGDEAHPLGISMGVAVVAPQSTETVEQVTARADEAMYAVKRRSKGSYAISGTDGVLRDRPVQPAPAERIRA
jgi:diguanylate cyclase (GGDEF)-like protein/PAS domain S-box-containing protein